MYHSTKHNSSSYRIVKKVSDLTEPKASDDPVSAVCSSNYSSIPSFLNVNPLKIKDQLSQYIRRSHPKVQRTREVRERFIRTEQGSRRERVIHIFEECSCIEMDTFGCIDHDDSNEDVGSRSVMQSKCSSCEDFKQYIEKCIDDPCSCLDPILPYQDGVPRTSENTKHGKPKQEFEKQTERVLDDLCLHPILPITLSCLMCCAWI